MKNNFIDLVKDLGIEINDSKLQALNKYYDFLIEYNNHTNLTGIVEESEVYLKHFYDSLTISKIIDLNKVSTVLDIGSGAGFPGIVLKIFFPHIKLTVLDSNNKKTKFLTELCNKLDLDVEVINQRAEEFAKDNLNKFDLVTSRAVAFMDIIIELSIPFASVNKNVVLMKGSLENEINILEKHYKELNIKSYLIKDVSYNDNIRNLVLLTKDKESNKVMNYSQILKRNKKWQQ